MSICVRIATIAILLSSVGSVFGQSGTSSPFPSSGVPVGKPLLTSPGQNLPSVAPKIGQPIGLLGLDGKPISTERPPGTPIDMKNLAAPLPAPLTGDASSKSIFEKVYAKWREAIGLSKPTTVAQNYTPGLSRRNRERRASMWQWD
jgi:hypothetical protein